MRRSSESRQIMNAQKRKQWIFELAVFPMLGAIMFCSKLLMEFLPNIHIVGMLIMLYTVVFRWKALIPIYIFVFLTGIYAGFGFWWLPYLYIWAVLWAVTMLLPKNMPRAAALVVYPIVCGAHGILFGVLYAPAQALMFGFDFEMTCAWIASGFYFDLLHGIGNVIFGTFVYPLSTLFKRLMKKQLNS